MRRFSYTLLLLLASCSSQTYYDRDRHDPFYHAGSSSAFFPILPLRATDILGSKPQTTTTRELAPRPMTSEELALTGMVLSGISIAMNRDYYKSSYLSGRCICEYEKELGFEVPCSNLTIVLKNQKGEPVAHIQSTDGEFVFSVDKNQAYRIGVESDRYRVTRVPTEPLKMGDNIVLHLMEKTPRLGE